MTLFWMTAIAMIPAAVAVLRLAAPQRVAVPVRARKGRTGR